MTTQLKRTILHKAIYKLLLHFHYNCSFIMSVLSDKTWNWVIFINMIQNIASNHLVIYFHIFFQSNWHQKMLRSWWPVNPMVFDYHGQEKVREARGARWWSWLACMSRVIPLTSPDRWHCVVIWHILHSYDTQFPDWSSSHCVHRCNTSRIS